MMTIFHNFFSLHIFYGKEEKNWGEIFFPSFFSPSLLLFAMKFRQIYNLVCTVIFSQVERFFFSLSAITQAQDRHIDNMSLESCLPIKLFNLLYSRQRCQTFSLKCSALRRKTSIWVGSYYRCWLNYTKGGRRGVTIKYSKKNCCLWVVMG